MKKFILGLLIGLLLPLLAAALFVHLGGMPVATKGGPLPFERQVARVALRAAIGREDERPSPLEANEANLVAGARVYREQCMVCHGTTDAPASAIAQGMFPRPPALVRADRTGVTDDPVGESYWKVRNGIRLTGMPGYVDTLTDAQLWQVSLVLLHAHELPGSASSILGGSAKAAP